MKTHIQALLAFALLSTALAAPALAAPHNQSGGPDSAKATEKSYTIESRLEYRFFEELNRKKRYTLALERTLTEPAVIRILAENGSQLYRAEVETSSLVRHFDLRHMEAGRYTLEILSGSQARQETILID